MARVKFTVTVSDGKGTRHDSGQVVDVDDAQAKTWLALGFVESAEEIGSSGKRTATKRAPRTATKKSEG